MKFISEHITCELPSKSENLELHNLVNKFQNHGCGNYCLRAIKSKKGKFCKACRFGFPRKITSKLILFDVIEAILGRKSSEFKKRLYHLCRKPEEARINDYNKLLLSLWQGNMDIQFISENSYSLVNYITKYVTKADKSHLSNDDFGIEDSIRRKLWKFAFSCLRTREMGAYEACDRWLVDRLYGCSDIFQFVSTVLPQFRTRIMKNFKDLENTSSESTEIFNKDLLSTYYPERPNDLENMPLKEFAATYERAYIPKNSDAESYCTKPNII